MDKNQVSIFNIGLNKDLHSKNYKEGHYTFQLNGINNSSEGDLTAITNERGNELCGVFPEGYIPIGSIRIEDNEVFFLKGPSSEIGILDKDCNYTTIINEECLNFNLMIGGTYRIKRGCNRIIYFQDGINPDRAINIDDIINNPTSHQYINPETGSFDCKLTKFNPNVKIPCVENYTINNFGGDLELGVYQIILQYEDKNGNSSYYFYHGPTIPIINGTYGSDYSKLYGGKADNDLTTNKSISFDITNIDQSYKYVNIIVRRTSNNISRNFLVDQIFISADSTSFVLTTINTNSVIELDDGKIVEEVQPYETSEVITQHDDRLLRANLKSKSIDYSKFQKKANQIKSSYFTKAIARSERPNVDGSVSNIGENTSTSGASKSATYYTDNKSYMRDEVYSFGIVWVFKDGTISPAFHIPGREANTPHTISNFPISDDNEHNRINNAQGTDINGALTRSWDDSYIKLLSGIGNPKDDIIPYIPSSLDNARHLNESDFKTINSIKAVQRWKLYNTAYRTEKREIKNGEIYTKGELAYYESQYEYPNTKDCEGNRIYPEGKIRYHKFPDTTLEEHFQNKYEVSIDNLIEYILPIGIDFFNIEPPEEYKNELEGYYIIREKRDNINKTILDKGIIFQNAFTTIVERGNKDSKKDYQFQTNNFNVHSFSQGVFNGSSGNIRLEFGLFPAYSDAIGDKTGGEFGYRNRFGFNYATRDIVKDFCRYDGRSNSFHSPLHKFNQSIFNGSFLKAERVFKGIFRNQLVSIEDFADNKLSKYFSSVEYNRNSIPGILQASRVIENRANIQPNEELPVGLLSKHFVNTTAQETLVIELGQSIVNNSGSLGSFGNDAILEKGINSVVDSDGRSGDGDSTCLYVSMKKNSNTIYGRLDNKFYYLVSNCIKKITETSTSEFGGDIFITKFSFHKSQLNQFQVRNGSNNQYVFRDSLEKGDEANDNTNINTLHKNLVTFYVESEINAELRHIDNNNLDDRSNTFWDLFSGNKEKYLSIDYSGSIPAGGDQEPETNEGAFGPWFTNEYAKNLYEYNSDYSKENDIKIFISLSQDFNFCNPCENEYPQRIQYSEKAFQEEREDSYLKFLSNSYRDLPPNNGPITNMFVNFDELYTHTERTLYKIFTKQQGLRTDQATLYVGTGDFFSVPPKELYTTKYGYGGSNQKWATLTTEFGTIFIDELSSKIFLLQEELKEISSLGLTNWFENNIKLNNWSNQPSLSNGTGYISTYDPRYKRIIITKKDFLTNNDIIENKSWTMSYSFLSNSWLSWHSYIPNFYTNDANDFFSYKNNEIWKHNSNNFQDFYGVKYNWIIDFPVFNLVTQSLSSIYWIADVQKYDEQNKEYLTIENKTFDKALVYNTTQSTGMFNIVPKTNPYQNVSWNNTTKIAVLTDRNWKVSGLRDLAITSSETILTSNWEDIEAEFIANGYIDKVSNNDLINTNKTLYEQADIKDKVNNIRLYFNPEENLKHTLFLINTANDQYQR